MDEVCFVIQPFDKDKFDKRYEDTFKPAIARANLIPYRVDRDPGVSIPIDEIERKIQNSFVCFADISTDNPNVWFELGYAIACAKEVVIACSDERKTEFPFDVRHRNIIEYKTQSKRDFDELESKITERIVAIRKKSQAGKALKEKPAEEKTASLIPADLNSVLSLINENRLLMNSKQVDLCLYTYETLAASLREGLLHSTNLIMFRVLIRNPERDHKKESCIKSSINTMVEVMSQNPKINFSVRFYDSEPLLRAYIFHKNNGETEGLFGFYKYDAAHPMRFVGAEDNYLIHAHGNSLLERHILDVFQNRFNYHWEKLTRTKGILFDLDGVLIDSMGTYCQAWSEGFRKVGISVSKMDIYEREGEKKEDTAAGIYRKYKGQEPNQKVIKEIIKTMEEEFIKAYKIIFITGVKDLLTLLRNKGIKLGLVTGSTTLAENKKFLKELQKRFDTIITGNDTPKGKPNPDPYLTAVEGLGVPGSDCLVIENAPLGIQSAVAAGLSCFAVKGNSPLPAETLINAGAIAVFENMQDLEKHLTWADTNIDPMALLKIFGS